MLIAPGRFRLYTQGCMLKRCFPRRQIGVLFMLNLHMINVNIKIAFLHDTDSSEHLSINIYLHSVCVKFISPSVLIQLIDTCARKQLFYNFT